MGVFFKILIIFVFSTTLFAKETIVIFAAAHNKFVLPEIIDRFTKKHPDTIFNIEYGASGKLRDSILEGVGYDIFLSADMNKPQEVYMAKKSATEVKKYSEGSLILVAPADKSLKNRGLEILKDSKIKKIAIANPKSAPYGKATIEVLKKIGIFEEISGKIIYTSDISTVIANMAWYDEAGFTAKSAIKSLPLGYNKEGVHYIEIDSSLHSPIEHGFVVSNDGIKREVVKNFVDFLSSNEALQIFREYGYK